MFLQTFPPCVFCSKFKSPFPPEEGRKKGEKGRASDQSGERWEGVKKRHSQDSVKERKRSAGEGRRERTHRNLFHCLLMWWSNPAVTLWHKSHTRTSAVHTEKGTPCTWCHWRKCKIYSFRWLLVTQHLLWSTFQQVGINVTSVCRWCSCNRCIWGTCPGVIWHSVVCWWKRLTAWLLYCKHYNHP